MLPAYNEGKSIQELIDRIAEVSDAGGWLWRALVVDDGSSDGTGDVARAMAAEGLPVEVVRNEPNQGLGYTIRRGLRLAAESADPGDAIITLDADLTQDPSYAASMLERLEAGYDVVIASRYRSGSGVQGLSLLRKVLSYGASGLVSLLLPIRGVRDYSCGYRAYRARVIQDAFAEYGDDFVSERGFACMLEIAEKLRATASFTEVPFVLRYDEKRKASEIRIGRTIAAYARVTAAIIFRTRQPAEIGPLGLAFASVLLGAVAQLLLRQGASGLSDMTVADTLLTALTLQPVLIGLALYAVSAALWLAVLSRIDLAVAYPLGASGYVLVVLFAAAAGEVVPPMRWLGVALILLGVLFVGWLGAAPAVANRPVEASES